MLRFCYLLFAVGLASWSAHPAMAAKKKAEATWDQPMRFVHVRAAGACEPLCPEWIAADGKITAGTSKRFSAFLKADGSDGLPLIIQSAGGDVTSAIAFGRIIRARNMNVAVGRVAYAGCAPDDKKACKPKRGIYRGTVESAQAYCNSACPVLFAGGVKRFVAGNAHLGVHQVTTTWTGSKILYRETYHIVNGRKKVISRKEIKRTSLKPKVTKGMHKDLRKALADYYNEMGINTALIVEAEKTPASKITALSQAALIKFKLVNAADGIEQLVDGSICKSAPPPANCVSVKP